jgi:signal transduction histidine kinase
VATDAQPTSPLLVTILRLVGDGATTGELDARLADLGLTPRDGLVEAVVAEAAALGLVRVATNRADVLRYVVTSLGQRRLAGGTIEAGDATGLRELEALRTDLSATIAHELRTPLTAIRTCAGLLLADDADPTEEQRRTLVETIGRNAERMQRVVGDILDLARFRSGSISLQLRRFDAVAMATAAVASLEPVAAARGVTVGIDAPHHVLQVFGDRRRLEQAFVNLLSNALRFAPAATTVRVRVARDGDQARLSVRDEGPGIPVADQPRLFERFFVGRADRGGVTEGVGLGLPTALAIAQAHGGRIDVESAPDAGSTFALVVPVGGPDTDDEVD